MLYGSKAPVDTGQSSEESLGIVRTYNTKGPAQPSPRISQNVGFEA
jgi:hypothetical protein